MPEPKLKKADRLRIAYLGFSGPMTLGGSSFMGWSLARGFAKRGNQVHILTQAPLHKIIRESIQKKYATPNIEVTRLPTRRYGSKAPPSKYGLYGRLSFRRRLKKEIKKNKPDVVFVNYGIPWAEYAADLCESENIPMVTLLHGTDVHNLLKPGFEKYRGKILSKYGKSNAIVTVSDYMKDLLNKWGLNNVVTISNTVDTSHFKPLPRDDGLASRLKIPKNAFVVSHVSNLRGIKRPMDIVYAAEKALKKNPDMHFLIIGEGPYRRKMAKLAKGMGIGDKFTFTGRIEQERLPEYLSIANAFALPSENEGLNLTVLEAQACGKAVVASRVGGTPEIVEHGKTGLLFEKGDVGAFADLLVELSKNPGLANSLGKNSEVERQKYTLDHAVEEYLSILNLAALK